ncbi:hypothetical protein M0812_02053 [Anaeramoeba flamelloides]|uniref:Uncharacterized protein n=1 Tax=Anaeramoeba flamelloides TaxID=1746091 RepID=A0AAV7YYM0_9EUKA|nr:hypothetical protein M0812_02053 [Anaeramoeba flamelloides]
MSSPLETVIKLIQNGLNYEKLLELSENEKMKAHENEVQAIEFLISSIPRHYPENKPFVGLYEESRSISNSSAVFNSLNQGPLVNSGVIIIVCKITFKMGSLTTHLMRTITPSLTIIMP